MTANKHLLEAEELMAYLDGELSTDRASTALAHLERCAECQALVDDFRNVTRQLMTCEVNSPEPRISAATLAALEDKDRKKPDTAKAGSRPLLKGVTRRRWQWAGAFVVVLAAVGLGVKLSTMNRQGSASFMGRNIVASSAPAAVPESNGLFHGQGDHAANSFSTDGQPATDQASKVPSTEEFLKRQISAQMSTSLENDSAPQPAGPMIVRTAGLSITTSDFDHARSSIDEILKRHRGYIGDLTVNTPAGAGRSLSATLRVPADQLDAALAELRKLGRVDSESQSGQEVTSQYIDLQARLSNARNTEKRLTDLLNQRTGKLSDVLAVETELDRVRGEIERMEAERKNLANQVALATINATVGEDYRAQLQVVPVTTFGRVRNAAVEGFETMVDGVVSVVLFLFSYGPSLLLWAGILFFPARWAWKSRRRLFD